MFLYILGGLSALLLILVLIVLFTFDSADHSQYDTPKYDVIYGEKDPSPQLQTISALIQTDMATPKLGDQKQQLANMRQQMDARGAAFDIEAKIIPIIADGVDAEWVVAPDVDLNRRMLYIHGGAYTVGSAVSHRPITSRLSKVANAAILVINYRLMPEFSRMQGIEDCQKAYLWILKNGPNDQSAIDKLIVAGDSSGGNIALSIIAWARNEGIKPADGAIVFSPQTDLTLSSPSLVINTPTDIMQGTSFGPIVKAPKLFRLSFSYLFHKIKPNNPIVSPLLGDLSNLPPTLIQVSSAEMFLDDAVRYANKANDHGSDVTLQVWPNVMHVWQAFDLPEADEAYTEVKKFIAQTL